MAIFTELRLALLADGQRLGVPITERDLESVLTRAQNEGKDFVYRALPNLGRALDIGLVTGHFTCPLDFSLEPLTCLPTFLYACFARIFDSGDGTLRPSTCITTLRYLRQFLLLDSKTDSEPSQQQRVAAIEGFQSRQSGLSQIRLPLGHPVLERAAKLLTRVLKRCSLRNITPGHGPGAVAEGCRQDQKWDFRTWPSRAEKVYPYSEYGVHLAPLGRVARSSLVTFRNWSATRVCLVPKDFRGPRLISAEMTVNQYLQQGQMHALMRYIKHQPLLRRSIRLDDQSFNQKRALMALDRGHATLDLSDASDLVSVPLVWKLLSGVPDLRRCLMATRSEFAFSGKQGIRLVAFAPMGSAVCFPVETLIFWALSMSAVKEDPVFRHESWDEIASNVAVFGDDIILPTTSLNFLTDILYLVGCKPNMSKTCFATPMRESCGSEWFNNSDVSITRNRKVHYEQDANVGQYHELLCLSRHLFREGLYNSSSVLARAAAEIQPVIQRDDTDVLPLRPRSRSTDDAQDRRYKSVDCAPDVRPTRNRCGRDGLSGVFTRYFHGRDFNEIDVAVFAASRRWERLHDYESDFITFVSKSYLVDRFPVSFASVQTNRIAERWNRSYQRREYRFLWPFVKTREWGPTAEQRLLARILGDNSQRLADRDLRYRPKWVWVP